MNDREKSFELRPQIVGFSVGPVQISEGAIQRSTSNNLQNPALACNFLQGHYEPMGKVVIEKGASGSIPETGPIWPFPLDPSCHDLGRGGRHSSGMSEEVNGHHFVPSVSSARICLAGEGLVQFQRGTPITLKRTGAFSKRQGRGPSETGVPGGGREKSLNALIEAESRKSDNNRRQQAHHPSQVNAPPFSPFVTPTHQMVHTVRKGSDSSAPSRNNTPKRIPGLQVESALSRSPQSMLQVRPSGGLTNPRPSFQPLYR